MKLSESMKHVMKTKRNDVFTHFWKKDIQGVIKDSFGDFKKITKRRTSIKESFSEAKTSIQDTLLLIKILPNRINEAFRIFTHEMITEMDKLPDSKEKTKFSMKVLAALSRFAVSSVYGSGFGEIKLIGKGRKPISNLMLSKLVFRLGQAFILRFVEEIEKEMNDPDELKNLQSFKEIVLDDNGNAVDKFFEGVMDVNDPAFKIVDNFKNYLFTGERIQHV